MFDDLLPPEKEAPAVKAPAPAPPVQAETNTVAQPTIEAPKPVIDTPLQPEPAPELNVGEQEPITWAQDIFDHVMSFVGHWFKWLVIGLSAIIVAELVVIAFSNYNLRSSILGQKFRSYTYANSTGNRYSILYYKGAVNAYENGSNTLKSPVLSSGGQPMILYISGGINATIVSNPNLQKEWSTNSNCANNLEYNIEGFSVYIKSLGVTANFCTNPEIGSTGHIFFISYFGNSQGLYYATLQPLNCGSGNACSQSLAKTQVNISDLKTIFGSLKYLGTN